MARQKALEEMPKRFRRQPGRGRELVLAAAHEEFSEHGYARATTRAIADRAGVAEPLLFRQFGSKAGLFNEVVFGPIRKFMLEFEKSHAEARDSNDLEARAKRFVEGLYDLLRSNRGLMLTYFTTHVFEPDVLEHPEGIPAFLEVIGMMDRLADKRLGPRKKATVKIRLHERINIGSVIAAALFDDLIFASMSARPTRNRIINELARIAVASSPETQA